MLVASIVFERKSSLQFKVSDTLKEVLLKTLPAFIVPFPIQKNYPLQDIMAVLHGGMVFDLCCATASSRHFVMSEERIFISKE